ncbi:hypothetical protein EDD86DRAFT_270967 [Gorgonomyces haynaldii]|nr:hypothetical protein EDD86DRAFT_270967 [Gorgonomyces haynaldii]
MEAIEAEIKKLSSQIEDIEVLLHKLHEDWTVQERNCYGDHMELRKEKEQLRKEREQLRVKEAQLRSLLILEKGNVSMEVDVSAFDPSSYKPRETKIFPFFDPVVEEYLNLFGDNALLARDNAIKQVNEIVSNRQTEKYKPIICGTSRGMGKTAFMEAIGKQYVKPELKCELIGEALAYGRVLSFDFAGVSVSEAIPSQEEIQAFFTRLMIYFLCSLFHGTLVDGIHFQRISVFSQVRNAHGKPGRFGRWLDNCLQLSADDMMDEYIRLTNIAFGVKSNAPPVFLLDEVQGLCLSTAIQSKFDNNQVVNHTYLSYLLTQLAGKHKPVCICTGTNSGNIMDVTEKSRIFPQFIFLTSLHLEEDYKTFWIQRTAFKNTDPQKIVQATKNDEDIINALVYASYQVPRLLLLAHEAWFEFRRSSSSTDLVRPLQDFEEKAVEYYSEMTSFIFNSDLETNEIPHILMSCGVHWKVSNVNSCVPGTKILWSSLIQKAIVFPYLDHCYVIPFSLLWAAKTPNDRKSGDYTRTKEGIKAKCASLIPNLDIENLFVSYDELRRLDLYNLGLRYESLLASSLAVKYYLCRFENNHQAFLPLLSIYDIDRKDTATKKSLSNISVDMSSGIHLPAQECFVNSPDVPLAVIHNQKSHNAHHDILLPAKTSSETNQLFLLPVSCKASFDLSPKETIRIQLKTSKQDGAPPVRLLLWMYLGNNRNEGKYAGDVVFLDGSGCCNGLALDMFILLKKLNSQNNKSPA